MLEGWEPGFDGANKKEVDARPCAGAVRETTSGGAQVTRQAPGRKMIALQRWLHVEGMWRE